MIAIHQFPSGILTLWHNGELVPAAFCGAGPDGTLRFEITADLFELGTKVSEQELDELKKHHPKAVAAALRRGITFKA